MAMRVPIVYFCHTCVGPGEGEEGIGVHLCPLHAGALAMRDALNLMLKAGFDGTGDYIASMESAKRQARILIAKATGIEGIPGLIRE